jgi:hypothetical protein
MNRTYLRVKPRITALKPNQQECLPFLLEGKHNLTIGFGREVFYEYDDIVRRDWHFSRLKASARKDGIVLVHGRVTQAMIDEALESAAATETQFAASETQATSLETQSMSTDVIQVRTCSHNMQPVVLVPTRRISHNEETQVAIKPATRETCSQTTELTIDTHSAPALLATDTSSTLTSPAVSPHQHHQDIDYVPDSSVMAIGSGSATVYAPRDITAAPVLPPRLTFGYKARSLANALILFLDSSWLFQAGFRGMDDLVRALSVTDWIYICSTVLQEVDYARQTPTHRRHRAAREVHRYLMGHYFNRIHIEVAGTMMSLELRQNLAFMDNDSKIVRLQEELIHAVGHPRVILLAFDQNLQLKAEQSHLEFVPSECMSNGVSTVAWLRQTPVAVEWYRELDRRIRESYQ